MLHHVTRALGTVYRSWRLRPTIELTLDWDGPLIYTVGVGEPPLTRAIHCVATATRRRPLTLVSGRLEVRFPATTDRGGPGWTGWSEVAPLERFVALPFRVASGECEEVAIPAASLAKRLVGAAFPTELAQLRVVAKDEHDRVHATNPLQISKLDLLPT